MTSRSERESPREMPKPCRICGGGNYMISPHVEPNPDRHHQKRCPGDTHLKPAEDKIVPIACAECGHYLADEPHTVLAYCRRCAQDALQDYRKPAEDRHDPAPHGGEVALSLLREVNPCLRHLCGGEPPKGGPLSLYRRIDALLSAEAGKGGDA